MYGYFWQDWFPFVNGNAPLSTWEDDEYEEGLIYDYFSYEEMIDIPPAYKVFYVGHVWRN